MLFGSSMTWRVPAPPRKIVVPCFLSCPYGAAPPPATAIATQFESGGDLVETGRDGPTVVVIGDLFTRVFWQDYFALHAKRYVWMHHEQCGFKLSVLDEYAADLVILAPVEAADVLPRNSKADRCPLGPRRASSLRRPLRVRGGRTRVRITSSVSSQLRTCKRTSLFAA